MTQESQEFFINVDAKKLHDEADRLRKSGQLDESHKKYLEAAELGSPYSMHNLGLMAMESGNTKEALLWFEQASKVGLAKSMAILGDYYAQNGDYANAKEWYLLAAKEGDAEAFYLMGQLAKELGKQDEAIQFWKLGADKSEPWCMVEYGRHLHGLSKLAEAEKLYRLAIDLGDSDAIKLLSALLSEQNKTDEALELLLSPLVAKDTLAMFMAGNIYMSLGEWKAAEEIWKRASDLGDQDALYAYGYHKLANGQQIEEIREGEVILLSLADEGNVDANFDLGRFYRHQGDNAKAKIYLEIARDSGNPEAAEVLRDL